MKKIALKRNTRSQLIRKVQLAPLQFDDASALSGIMVSQFTKQGEEQLVAQTPMFLGAHAFQNAASLPQSSIPVQSDSSVLFSSQRLLPMLELHQAEEDSQQNWRPPLPKVCTAQSMSVADAGPSFCAKDLEDAGEARPQAASLSLEIYSGNLELAELIGRAARIEAVQRSNDMVFVLLERCAGSIGVAQ